MNPLNRKFKIVQLLEPALCLSCRHAVLALVTMADGPERQMMHCRRLDCDNWEWVEAAAVPVQVTPIERSEDA